MLLVVSVSAYPYSHLAHLRGRRVPNPRLVYSNQEMLLKQEVRGRDSNPEQQSHEPVSNPEERNHFHQRHDQMLRTNFYRYQNSNHRQAERKLPIQNSRAQVKSAELNSTYGTVTNSTVFMESQREPRSSLQFALNQTVGHPSTTGVAPQMDESEGAIKRPRKNVQRKMSEAHKLSASLMRSTGEETDSAGKQVNQELTGSQVSHSSTGPIVGQGSDGQFGRPEVISPSEQFQSPAVSPRSEVRMADHQLPLILLRDNRQQSEQPNTERRNNEMATRQGTDKFIHLRNGKPVIPGNIISQSLPQQNYPDYESYTRQFPFNQANLHFPNKNSMPVKQPLPEQLSALNQQTVSHQSSMSERKFVSNQPPLPDHQPMTDQQFLQNQQTMTNQQFLPNQQTMIDQQAMTDQRFLPNQQPMTNQQFLSNQQPLTDQQFQPNQQPMSNHQPEMFQQQIFNQQPRVRSEYGLVKQPLYRRLHSSPLNHPSNFLPNYYPKRQGVHPTFLGGNPPVNQQNDPYSFRANNDLQSSQHLGQPNKESDGSESSHYDSTEDQSMLPANNLQHPSSTSNVHRPSGNGKSSLRQEASSYQTNHKSNVASNLQQSSYANNDNRRSGSSALAYQENQANHPADARRLYNQYSAYFGDAVPLHSVSQRQPIWEGMNGLNPGANNPVTDSRHSSGFLVTRDDLSSQENPLSVEDSSDMTKSSSSMQDLDAKSENSQQGKILMI